MHVFDGVFYVLFGQSPIVIEIGNHLFHEWFGQPNRKSLVAKMIVKDCERELLRARALVGPLEAPFCELFDVVMLAQRTAINRHAKPVDLSSQIRPAARHYHQMLGYRLPPCKAEQSNRRLEAESHRKRAGVSRRAAFSLSGNWP